MIAAGNRIDRFAYSYGGAHGDPRADDEPVRPEPSRGAWARRRTAARGTTARRRPRTCCGAAGSGRACSAAASWCRAMLESVGEPGPGKWVTIFATPGTPTSRSRASTSTPQPAWATRPTRRRRGRGGAPSGPGRPASSNDIHPVSDLAAVRSRVIVKRPARAAASLRRARWAACDAACGEPGSVAASRVGLCPFTAIASPARSLAVSEGRARRTLMSSSRTSSRSSGSVAVSRRDVSVSISAGDGWSWAGWRASTAARRAGWHG